MTRGLSPTDKTVLEFCARFLRTTPVKLKDQIILEGLRRLYAQIQSGELLQPPPQPPARRGPKKKGRFLT